MLESGGPWVFVFPHFTFNEIPPCYSVFSPTPPDTQWESFVRDAAVFPTTPSFKQIGGPQPFFASLNRRVVLPTVFLFECPQTHSVVISAKSSANVPITSFSRESQHLSDFLLFFIFPPSLFVDLIFLELVPLDYILLPVLKSGMHRLDDAENPTFKVRPLPPSFAHLFPCF